jgi:hypothetical protein
MRKCVGFKHLSLAIALFLASLFIAPVTEETSAYTPHSPIYINGNANFTLANGVTNGSGILSDPYVIEGWDIDVAGINGIEILNTDVHFVIRDVYIHGGWELGVRFVNVTHGGVENSTITKSGDGVRFELSEWCNITGNYFSIRDAVQIYWGGHNFTIEGNTIDLPGYSVGVGINIPPSGTSDVTIINNTINTGFKGIVAREIVRSVISDNILNGSEENAVIQDSTLVSVTGNFVSGAWLGIGQLGGRDNVYYRNVVTNNHFGLYFRDVGAPNIARFNLLQDNTFGVFFFNTGGNYVYHNDFINSAGYDGPGSNVWDNGYPSGGNYWSAYAGVDNCSGPNQDVCPDPDGIADSPYNFNAAYWDYYPLIAPMELGLLRPPKLLSAELSGASFRDVKLTWRKSLDDGRGLRTVVGYGIYRNTTLDSSGLGYQLIASVPNGTEEFIDPAVGEGDPSNYFYMVCAMDMGSNSSCAENQAGKFTRPLSIGMNLVSIPLIQSGRNVDAVLRTVTFDKAWTFDSSNQEWMAFARSKPYLGDLGNVNHTIGLWVEVTGASNLTIAGIVPSTSEMNLEVGWNLVGFPSFNTTYTVSDLKMSTGATRVEGFDAFPSLYNLRMLADAETVEAGHGFWVKVDSGSTWIVECS